MSALYIIPILAILILIHEIGHFATAKLTGVRVEEFGIGIPPRLFGFRRGGVLYSINLLPIGGFVRVLGEDGKSYSADSLQSKSRLQRLLFFSAGSLMNFLLAFVLVTVLVGVQGEPKTNVYVGEVEPGSPAAAAHWQVGDRFVEVNNQPVTGVDQIVTVTNDNAGHDLAVTLRRGNELITTTVVPRTSPPPGRGRVGIRLMGASEATVKIAAIDEGSAASTAGLQTGDVITSVAGQKIDDSAAFTLALQNHAGSTVPVTVKRNGTEQSFELAVPRILPAQSGTHTGMTISESVTSHPIAWWKIVPRGAQETVSTIGRMFSGLALLVRGDAPVSGIAGPIGMGQLTSEVLKVSAAPVWVTLTNIMILLSLNLAVLNLLPLPALDGGRIFFVIIESIRGKRIPAEKEGMVHFVGLVLLLMFMLVVAYFDIDRLVTGQTLLH